jgi:transcription antitermination factor NusG
MGITAFVPSEWRWRKKSRHAQPTKTSYPAYKSVVFVGQGSKVLPWWKFEENHLIIGCYAHPVSGLPRQIATEDIKQVMRAAKTPLFELHDEPEGEAFVYQAGDLVRITDGLMNGEVMSIAEVVDGVAKFYREMMGKRLEISVPVDGLELQHRAA